MKYAWTALLTVGLAGAALADEVHLTNGRTIIGIVNEQQQNGRVLVETGLGDIGFPKAEVESIVPGRTPLHEYRERLGALGASAGAAEVFALAQWAQNQGLIRYVNGLLQRTIALDPNHAEARELLGFVRYQGHWIKSSERDAVMAVQEEHQARAAARRVTVPVRRTTPQPERTPYWLGFPPMLPPRGSTNHDTGYIPYFPYTRYAGNIVAPGAAPTMAPSAPSPRY
jgi:hypothetical protein